MNIDFIELKLHFSLMITNEGDKIELWRGKDERNQVQYTRTHGRTPNR